MPLDEQQLRAVISGQRRDLSAMLMRAGLTPASWIYAAAMRWRNWRFDCRPDSAARVARPVVSVGNITTGGTGKTPMVAWIAQWLRRRHLRAAIISRGYGAEEGARNDEALELEQRLPDVPHLQNPDRVAAAKTAIEELDSQVLVLDDAMQHRRIHRDLNLVLIDALHPFGYGHVLPRGLLREPLSGLQRADVVVLTRADQVDAPRRDEIKAAIARVAPEAAWAEAAHRPRTLLSHSGDRQSCESLAASAFGAFCGIGNPAGFQSTLTEIAGSSPPLLTFPDHHAFDREDLDRIAAWASDQQLDTLVCTHKDLVKIGVDQLGQAKLFALIVELEFLSGEDELDSRLLALMERIPLT